jgi:K+-sensing histidine kinase KdpD
MFINLYSNAFHAIKKSDSKERTILIEAFKSREGEATIRVSDTGGGIPDSVLPNIFDPFYTTKSIEEGTGLGLSVSYGFVLPWVERLRPPIRNWGFASRSRYHPLLEMESVTKANTLRN